MSNKTKNMFRVVGAIWTLVAVISFYKTLFPDHAREITREEIQAIHEEIHGDEVKSVKHTKAPEYI